MGSSDYDGMTPSKPGATTTAAGGAAGGGADRLGGIAPRSGGADFHTPTGPGRSHSTGSLMEGLPRRSIPMATGGAPRPSRFDIGPNGPVKAPMRMGRPNPAVDSVVSPSTPGGNFGNPPGGRDIRPRPSMYGGTQGGPKRPSMYSRGSSYGSLGGAGGGGGGYRPRSASNLNPASSSVPPPPPPVGGSPVGPGGMGAAPPAVSTPNSYGSVASTASANRSSWQMRRGVSRPMYNGGGGYGSVNAAAAAAPRYGGGGPGYGGNARYNYHAARGRPSSYQRGVGGNWRQNVASPNAIPGGGVAGGVAGGGGGGVAGGPVPSPAAGGGPVGGAAGPPGGDAGRERSRPQMWRK